MAATNELFRRRGFNGTSLSAIAELSGAPTGSIYHFFPEGKTALAEAVIVETGAAYRQLFELVAAEATGPVEAVEAFFAGAGSALADDDFVDICPIGTVAREVASENDRLRRAADAAFAGWVEALSIHLVDGGIADDEATTLATTVIALLEGSFILARTGRDAALLERSGRHAAALVEAAMATATAARR